MPQKWFSILKRSAPTILIAGSATLFSLSSSADCPKLDGTKFSDAPPCSTEGSQTQTSIQNNGGIDKTTQTSPIQDGKQSDQTYQTSPLPDQSQAPAPTGGGKKKGNSQSTGQH